MVAGSLVAVVIAVLVQDRSLGEVLHVVQYGHEGDSPVESVNFLLNRGGIQSMMWSMSLAMIALALGGLLNGIGYLRVLMTGVIRHVNSVGKLVVTTILTCFASNLAPPRTTHHHLRQPNLQGSLQSARTPDAG